MSVMDKTTHHLFVRLSAAKEGSCYVRRDPIEVLTAFRNGGAGSVSRQSNLMAHICASLRQREDGDASPYLLQFRREAEECATIWSYGARFAAGF